MCCSLYLVKMHRSLFLTSFPLLVINWSTLFNGITSTRRKISASSTTCESNWIGVHHQNMAAQSLSYVFPRKYLSTIFDWTCLLCSCLFEILSCFFLIPQIHWIETCNGNEFHVWAASYWVFEYENIDMDSFQSAWIVEYDPLVCISLTLLCIGLWPWSNFNVKL